MTKPIPFHPLSELFPLIEGREFDDLVADIKANGLREAIWIYNGQILDGRNRYRACQAAGIEPASRQYAGDDALGFVLSLNLRRRHLDESRRAMVAARIANIRHGGQGGTVVNSGIPPLKQSDAAERLNVSVDTVKQARKVIDRGVEGLAKAVDSGEISVSAAADVTSLPDAELQKAVAEGPDAVLEAAKKVRREKHERRAALSRAPVASVSAATAAAIPRGPRGFSARDTMTRLALVGGATGALP
jgi:ParB-like chromosome segregation protein Spo0J